MQRQVRLLLKPLDNEGAMRLKNALAMATHLAGRNRACPAVPLRPLHHRRYRNPEPRRR
jgi:hypothetical protein